jgi:hypothetical protein
VPIGMNTIELATLEEVTKDDEQPAQADQVDGPVSVANGTPGSRVPGGTR